MTLIISKGLTLDNGTRPAAIAGVAPTLDYRFARDKREIETVSLLDKLTYTGGNGTFVGSDGYIQPATTNLPRFDHDPLSRISEGLLMEESRENLLLQSEDFSTTWNTGTSTTVTTNYGAAPDGTMTADRVQMPNTTQTFVNQSATTVNGQPYVFSIYARATSGTSPVVFELGSASQSITLSETWQRYTVSFTATSSTTTSTIDNGANAIDVLIWGAQLEEGDFPTSYIPTTTSTVIRTADSAVIDGTGILTGTYTIVEKPAGCAVESGGNIELQEGYTTERVMVFPASLSAQQITDIRSAM